MDTDIKNEVINRLPVLFTVFLVVVVTIFLPRLSTKYSLAQIPLVGVELGNEEKRRKVYLAAARRLYEEGYRKFKNGIFRITTPNEVTTIVLHQRFLDEVKKLPDHVLSFSDAIAELLVVKYSKIPHNAPLATHSVKADLTPSLMRLNPRIAEEVDFALQQEMPACDDWTRVNIYQKLLRVVAKVSGRLFVGPELCRDEKYLDAAINYTVELMNCINAVKRVRPILRPFVSPFLPERRKLNQRLKEAKDMMGPVIRARRTQTAKGSEKPDDMLQWMIDKADKFGVRTEEELTTLQLGLTFAAIHTTTLSGTNTFYDLSARPEYIPELREEIRTVLAKHNGVFTSSALQEMKKLDSFIKETLRLYPPSFASFQRKVLQGFTLSNGQYIPRGVIIEVPAYSIMSDPDVFPDGKEFDGLRFYKLRQSSSGEAANRYQLVSVNQHSLTFGFGRHACPGRFFAANEIKLIMARALLTWDIKNIEGHKERYPNLDFSSTTIPDPSKELLFKKAYLS